MQEEKINVRVLQYNIDAANREQQTNVPVLAQVPHLFFQNRVEGIIETIKKSDATIATLQELRDLESSPVKIEDLVLLIKEKTELEVVGPFFYDKSRFSFALATLYDRSLFFLVNTGLISLPGDKICLWILFERIADRKRFIIANTHFSVEPESVKMEQINVLFDSLRTIRSQNGDCPLLVNGDYNLFDDLEGTAQRNHVLNVIGCQDVYHPLFMQESDTEPMSGTFIGYPEVDSHHKTPETMSRLDHGFLLAIPDTVEISKAFTIGVTPENLATATLPSDHLPCVVDLSF